LLSNGFIQPMIKAGFTPFDIAMALAWAAGEVCTDTAVLQELHKSLAAGYSTAQRDNAQRSVPVVTRDS
jgi:hypothetical protein